MANQILTIINKIIVQLQLQTTPIISFVPHLRTHPPPAVTTTTATNSIATSKMAESVAIYAVNRNTQLVIFLHLYNNSSM